MNLKIKYYLLIIFSFFLIAYIIYLSFSNEVNEYEYVFENKIIDIGKISQKKITIAKFKIKNLGKKSFTIEKIITDCHCISTVWDANEIESGKTSIIKLQYDNKTKGYFEQTATVYINNEPKPPILLIFRGYITD